MSMTTAATRQQFMTLSRAELSRHQLARLNELLANVVPRCPALSDKLATCPRQLHSLDELPLLPVMTKEDMQIEGEGSHLPANLTQPMDAYVRYHQTSGTKGRPLPVLDTADDWRWWIDCWQYVLDAAEVTSQDRAVLAFSFGPFIGFWSAHDALMHRGTMVIPAGGMGTLARLEMIQRTEATVLFCTPSYALHLAEVAEHHNIDLSLHSQIRKIIVAGEAGGSVPSTRARIESVWNARVTDHSGASEIGPWGFGDSSGTGLHVLETEFIAEFLAIDSDQPAGAGQLAQLVLTNLGRHGMPVIRYRTGDLVRPAWPRDGACRFVLLQGGVLGRADDMLVVRGVNIFPSSIEQIMLSFPEVAEYRFTIRKQGEMDEMTVEVEDRLREPQRIADELMLRLGLRVNVQLAEPSSLPRFEGKGRRFIDERGA